MKDPKNITIAMLCVSAAILTTVLVLARQPAMADTPAAAGDYIVVTGAYSEDIDLLYVIDRSQQTINAYVLDLTKGEMLLKSTANLKPAFQKPR